jgi:two-component system phosphate regulon sensor histidine kinase PhoR
MTGQTTARTLRLGTAAAAPGFIGLAVLVGGGWLAVVPALWAAAIIWLLMLFVVNRHVVGLGNVERRIDSLAAGKGDPRLEAPTLAPLARAVARLGRALQDRESALAAGTATAERVLEALPDPLIIVSRGGNVTRANRAAEALAEMRLTDRPVTAAFRHPELLHVVEAALAGKGASAEISLPVPAPRSYSAVAEPLGEAGALVLLHDLTALRLSERMRADFVANVSHELRTPLSSLLGFVETLRGPAREDPEAQQKFLAIMQEQAERMTRLIEDLLSLSRIEMDEHTRPDALVAPDSVIAKVRDLLAMKAADRGMTIEIRMPPDVPPIAGDEDQLIQVLQNLLDNAVKYGSPGTAVEVTVTADQREIAIAVRDHGEGIAPEHLPRLTERFYRVDAARSRALGGTGLGLAIVKHIVNRHRGRFEIESTLGAGSTFTVRLPVSQPAGAEKTDEPGAAVTKL